MGLFDTIECDYPLPNPRHQDLEFQTKDLDCLLDRYSITRDGRLLKHARGGLFEEGLLLLITTSLGLRRSAALVGYPTWRTGLPGEGEGQPQEPEGLQ